MSSIELILISSCLCNPRSERASAGQVFATARTSQQRRRQQQLQLHLPWVRNMFENRPVSSILVPLTSIFETDPFLSSVLVPNGNEIIDSLIDFLGEVEANANNTVSPTESTAG